MSEVYRANFEALADAFLSKAEGGGDPDIEELTNDVFKILDVHTRVWYFGVCEGQTNAPDFKALEKKKEKVVDRYKSIVHQLRKQSRDERERLCKDIIDIIHGEPK